jgi:hypothetical protein
MDEKDMDRYCKCMEEIKLRVEAVNAILQKRCKTLCIATNIEFMCLQIRGILELIALASLVTDEKEYKTRSKELASNPWNAKVILREIERVNPNFYPVPGKQIKDPKTNKVKEVIDVSEGYLSREEFPSVYNKCSDVIHSHPFYAGGFDYLTLENDIPIWIRKIRTLLNHHQIQLLNEKEQLWIIMKADSDGKVHTALMERLEPSEFQNEIK